MKKALNLVMILAITISFVMCGGPAYAQEKKIAFVDLGKVFDNYSKTKEFDKVLEGKAGEKDKERKVFTGAIQKLQDEIELLSADARFDKQEELEKKVNELREFDRSAANTLRRERDGYVREILAEIQKIVDEYAKTNDYDLVLNSRVLLYGTEEHDLTGTIAEKLNSEYKPSKKK